MDLIYDRDAQLQKLAAEQVRDRGYRDKLVLALNDGLEVTPAAQAHHRFQLSQALSDITRTLEYRASLLIELEGYGRAELPSKPGLLRDLSGTDTAA